MIRAGWIIAAVVCLVTNSGVAATQKSAAEGRWEATSNTANGPLTVTYTFEAKEQALTGTEESPMFSRSISEGKVNGDRISFKTTVNGNLIEHQGIVSDDKIQLRNFGPGGEFDLTLRRVSIEKKPERP
jgi:hypothetical protein